MQKMTRDEAFAFLAEAPRSAKIATVRADGRPHVVPIWIILDGEDILFTAWYESVKVKNMQRDDRIAICVDQDGPQFNYVMIEGRVSVMDKSLEGIQHWTYTIAERYEGKAGAEQAIASYGKEGEWVFRLVADKVIGYKDVTA